MIQRDVLVCGQSDRRHDSLQIYIAAVGGCFLWLIRTLNAFVRRHSTSNHFNVTCFWLHAQVYRSFLLYIWIQSKEAVNLECYWRVISGQTGESLLFRLALAWQLQDVRLDWPVLLHRPATRGGQSSNSPPEISQTYVLVWGSNKLHPFAPHRKYQLVAALLLQQLSWPLNKLGSLWKRDRPTNRHRNQLRILHQKDVWWYRTWRWREVRDSS